MSNDKKSNDIGFLVTRISDILRFIMNDEMSRILVCETQGNMRTDAKIGNKTHVSAQLPHGSHCASGCYVLIG